MKDDDVFVQRADDGTVKGIYSLPQPGVAEETLPPTDPSIMAFYAKIQMPIADPLAPLLQMEATQATQSSAIQLQVDNLKVAGTTADIRVAKLEARCVTLEAAVQAIKAQLGLP